jgi:hypothetical protein
VNARSCIRADGRDKVAYATFDEAWEALLRDEGRTRERLHPYRCDRHGYHLGHAKPVRRWS